MPESLLVLVSRGTARFIDMPESLTDLDRLGVASYFIFLLLCPCIQEASSEVLLLAIERLHWCFEG